MAESGDNSDYTPHERVQTGGSIHDNFMREVQALLDKSDVREEDRRHILANMSCPCCGGSAGSLNIKLGE